MNKFLKKNYKKILIVCLILLLLSNNMYENFTTTQALDAVKSTEKKVNDIVSKVDGTHVRFNKNVYLDKGLAMGSLKMAPGNWLDYGIEVPAGKKLGIHAPGNGTMELHVDNKVQTQKLQADELCLGNKCINSNHLSMLLDGFYFKAIGGSAHHKDSWIHNHGDRRIGPTNCGGKNNKDCATRYRMAHHT